MPEPAWVSFLSDYGLDDSFVGVCHGVIGRLAPAARIIDVCHQVSPQDVEQGATVLASAVGYLPVGLSLALVDPVGKSQRRGIAVRTANGAVFVSPDNGLASLAWEQCGGVVEAFEIAERSLFLPNPSPMFRGRDMFAPVVGHLAAGRPLTDVGPRLEESGLRRLELREPTVEPDHVHGEVRAVDHFGNLSLNVTRADLEAAGIHLGDTLELRLGGRSLQVPFSLTYGEVSAGRVAVCEDSYRQITVAVNLGDAAAELRAGRGDPIVLSRVARRGAEAPQRIGVYDPPPKPVEV